MLNIETLLPILACIALASILQVLSGFGFGLIVIAFFTLFDLLPLTASALLVSVLGLTNSSVAVIGALREVNWKVVRQVLVTGIPAMLAGLWLLEYLSEYYIRGLKLLLGFSIILCCLTLYLKRHPRSRVSPSHHFYISGIAGGLLGGLFSTFGPPVVFMLYRQPWSMATIRFTLLAIFSISALLRTGFAGLGTLPEGDFWWLILLAMPVVMLMTECGRRIAPKVPITLTRQLAAGLLLISGMFIVISNW